MRISITTYRAVPSALSRRTPFARFNSGMLSPKIDVAENKDAIEVMAELPGVDEKDVDVMLAKTPP